MAKLQDRKKWMKKSKVACVTITCMLELKQYCIPLRFPEHLGLLNFDSSTFPALVHLPPMLALPMPSPLGGDVQPLISSISSTGCMNIPLDALPFNCTGALFTGRMQIYWIGQLMNMPHRFVLHADGKHKLHHGEWILMSVGTHMLRWDAANGTLSTTFVPLVYLFCKEHESNGSCLYLVRGLEMIAKKYFPTDAQGNAISLVPGACMSDHCDGFRNAFMAVFPEVRA